jgi:regulator of replication initiation timing
MSDNITELLAEIERQRAELKDAIGLIERLREEIRHLRATLDDRMIRQDAAQATMRGSLAPHPADDEPGNYTHDVKPNAPR